MNLKPLAFPLFLLIMPPLAMEMLGFDWKSTELGCYGIGFCIGIVLGAWLL